LIDTWIPGYLKRLNWLRSKLADYAYRGQLILADWATVRSGQKSLWAFIADRSTVRRFFRREQVAEAGAEPAYATARAYDHWLLNYTTAMLDAYEPKPIRGRLTIFRSASEPAGRFLDPKLGWGEMAEDGVDVIVVPGDHYSVFKDPGASIMAKYIAAATGSNVQ
jgi:thioesterase domain-containing protein